MSWKQKAVIYIIFAAVIGGGLFYFLGGLRQVSLEEFELTGITDLDANSFTFSGNLFLKNPSSVSVPIKSITYDIILKENNEVISSGTIPPVLIQYKTITKVPIEQEVKWVPTAQLFVELLKKEKVYVIVKGKIRLDVPKLEEYEIPFEKEMDINDYIRQFVGKTLPTSPLQDKTNDSIIPKLDLI